MAKQTSESKKHENKTKAISPIHEIIPSVVRELYESCGREDCFDNVDSMAFPSRESVVRIIHQTRGLLFPGYFSPSGLGAVNLKYHLGQETTTLFKGLSEQIMRSFRHGCFGVNQPCSDCMKRGHEAALSFLQTLPKWRVVLAKDVRASLEGDPAAKSREEVIFSYPGLLAITVYRLAHTLHQLQVPILPRMMTEYAHSLTGIDIHPGAKIGESFFIDHGTGVVVGETTEIGDRVRLYQGVTLGALSLPRNAVEQYRNKRRHPTIGDDVIIYSNATVLGEKAIIGARSIIGGNVWITDAVPPDTKVLLKSPELIYIGNHLRQGQYPLIRGDDYDLS